MIVYIPSYFGSSLELVQKRLEKHEKQLDWVLSSSYVDKIVICSQNYTPLMYRKNDKIMYIDAPVSGASAAKNVLLEHHYKNENIYDPCIFLDNDVYSDYDLDFFIKISNKLQKEVNWNLLGFIPHNLKKEKFSLGAELKFKKSTKFSTAFFMMSGIKNVYCDINLNGLIDIDFWMQNLMLRNVCLKLEDYMLVELPTDDSVMFENVSRSKIYKTNFKFLNEKYNAIAQELGYSSLNALIKELKYPKEIKIKN